MKSSSCKTCSKPIRCGNGGYEPLGWYDPDVADDLNDGRTCETTGDEHVPGEVQS